MWLDPGEATTLRRLPRGSRVTCTGGILWLTASGDQTDYILLEGDSYVIGAQGLVVVSPIGRSEFSLVRPQSLPAIHIPQAITPADC